MSNHWAQLCAGLMAAMVANTAFADSYALLVGVSGYPSLPAERRLRGPANDVQLMREVLLQAGVAPGAIRLLADGVPGSAAMPTHSEILASFRGLAERVKPDDWAIVYFSGHGSQQPQPPGSHSYIEPDGLDEIFLPYDIGRWDGGKMVVEGALVDDEIGLALEAITRRGAHVWAIFDTCHAGDMAKGGAIGVDGPVERYVSPNALGVPDSEIDIARKRQDTKPQKQNLSTVVRIPVRPMLPAKMAQRSNSPSALTDRSVIFYASHSEEPAAEEPLPDQLSGFSSTGANTLHKRYFGLFTYLIAQALPSWHGSFKQLAQQVEERYKTRPYPTPMFEGDLDRVPEFSGRTLTQFSRPGL